jgi:hypothetical protein
MSEEYSEGNYMRAPGSLTLRKRTIDIINRLLIELKATINGGGAIEYTCYYIDLINNLIRTRRIIREKIHRYTSCINYLNDFTIIFAEISAENKMELSSNVEIQYDCEIISINLPVIIMNLTILRSRYYVKMAMSDGDNIDEYESEDL